jgi:hypothetical protein
LSTRMFDELSENWQLVRSRLGDELVVEPDFNDGFVCPICFKLFSRDQIAALSREHVPPKRLGGEPITLTCRLCNNVAGYELEHHLLKKADFDAFNAGPSERTLRGQATVNKNTTLPISFLWTDQNTWGLVPPDEVIRNNPKQIDQFTRQINAPQPSIDLSLPGWNLKKADISILKAAYLIAFSNLGYIFALNPNIHQLRQQILEPDQPIWTEKSYVEINFPDEMSGINILTHPRELRSFLVVFDTVKDGYTHRYGVFLPGYSEPGLDIYDTLREFNGKDIDFKAKTFLSMPMNDYPLRAYEVWLDLNG